MACIDFNEFTQYILAFDQSVEIDKKRDKRLRYNVWNTTSAELKEFVATLDTAKLGDPDQSPRIRRKLNSSIRRIKESSARIKILNDIFSSRFNIETSIALHELMESVKGESDKARKRGIEIQKISSDGVLPVLPLSRVAASIGRKIAFQKGYRFKRATDNDSAAHIESFYYDIGREAINQLEKLGYVNTHDKVSTIMDYESKSDLKKDFPKNEPTRSDVLSVSLNSKKLKIEPGTDEQNYFIDRTASDLEDTDLGVATEKLRMAALITQPNITFQKAFTLSQMMIFSMHVQVIQEKMELSL